MTGNWREKTAGFLYKIILYNDAAKLREGPKPAVLPEEVNTCEYSDCSAGGSIMYSILFKYEKKKPQTREHVVLAVMTALTSYPG